MYNKNHSLPAWLKYLEQIDKKKIFNLIELKKVAEKLNVLNSQAFIFTVGGTNGKGSTCAILEKLLLNSGYKVGLYSSPHLINYTERVKINGYFIEEEQHIDSFKKIESVKGSTALSYFEFITLSALMLFKQYPLDVIILEVGLGGRLDATNIIDSNLSVITNIGIDHTSILGEDRLSIAREKSGIFRENTISVIGDKDIPDLINQIAKQKKTILKKVNVDWFWEKKDDNHWHFIHSYIKLYNLPMTHILLSNTSIALASLYYSGLKINEKIIRNSISTVQLLGRFQKISNFPHIILDVAHNSHASLELSKKIDQISVKGKIYAIVGMMKDKNISEIIYPLKNKIHCWYAAPLQTIRTATISQLKIHLPRHNTYVFNSINQAFKKICTTIDKKDVILIFGSFLTVSEFINAQNIENKKKILNNIIVEYLCCQ